MSKKNIWIKPMQGIGDLLYTRPFVKVLSQDHNIYMETVLPAMFKDIPNIKYVDPQTLTYRTQQKQREFEVPVKYHKVPDGLEMTYPYYIAEDIGSKSIVAVMYDKFGMDYKTPIEWSLPDFSAEFADRSSKTIASIIPWGKQKIAIIRPSTIRKEWEIYTRSPKPEYIAWCCKVLNEAGYFTVSIADLEPKKEWLQDAVDVPAQLKLHSGELGIYGTFELIKRADIVVAGSGFCIPAAVSAGTPIFTIFGGRQKFDSVYKVFHPSMNLHKIGWATPANPCKCSMMKHDCNKVIPTLDVDFYDFLRRIS